MATLDSSIVNIALPTLARELEFNMPADAALQHVKWVVVIYLLVITCLLLPFGRLSDQYGRRKVFGFGFIIFTLGSSLCAFSTTLGWLVISRIIQAAGGAMLMANGPAVITAAFPASERGTALGTMAMVVSAGLISGPSIGGLLISELGWRSIFLVNLPIGMLGFLLVYRFISPDAHPKGHKLPFDWAGALLQTIILLSSIVLFDPPSISFSGGDSIPIPRWALAILIVFLTAIFVRVEADARAPLFDLSLLKDRIFWTANVASFLIFVAISSPTILMPFYLEEVMHFSTKKTGAFMTAVPLTILIVAPISGRLSDRFGSRGLSVGGALICALSLFLFFGWGLGANASQLAIALGLSSLGLSLGLFQSPNNNAIMSSVPFTKLGVASALLATVRNLGLVIGTGMAASLHSWRMSMTKDFMNAMHFSEITAGAVAAGAIVACLGKPRRPRVPATQGK
jgi:EmrB/QacA subfamily drug resistance transporter